MKANELMIGDWVFYSKKAFPYQVKLLGENLCKLDGIDNSVDLDDVHPVLLTMEILVRNRFRKNDIEYIYQNIANDGCVHVMLLDTGCGTWDITIKDYNKFEDNQTVLFKANNVFLHLHELQHYLRLCGIEKEIEL